MLKNTDELSKINFTASIGEPWDFMSEAGENKLSGYIVKKITMGKNNVFLCKVLPFEYKGNTITQVIIVNRYRGEQVLDRLEYGKSYTVNFFFSTKGKIISTNEVKEFLEIEKERFFLVGSFELIRS